MKELPNDVENTVPAQGIAELQGEMWWWDGILGHLGLGAPQVEHAFKVTLSDREQLKFAFWSDHRWMCHILHLLSLV